MAALRDRKVRRRSACVSYAFPFDDGLGGDGVGRLLDRLKDAHVAGAAAEISGESFLYLFEGWVGILVQQMVCGQDHTRRADAALRAPSFEEALLNRVQAAFRRNAFNGAEP